MIFTCLRIKTSCWDFAKKMIAIYSPLDRTRRKGQITSSSAECMKTTCSTWSSSQSWTIKKWFRNSKFRLMRDPYSFFQATSSITIPSSSEYTTCSQTFSTKTSDPNFILPRTFNTSSMWLQMNKPSSSMFIINRKGKSLRWVRRWWCRWGEIN